MQYGVYHSFAEVKHLCVWSWVYDGILSHYGFFEHSAGFSGDEWPGILFCLFGNGGCSKFSGLRHGVFLIRYGPCKPAGTIEFYGNYLPVTSR